MGERSFHFVPGDRPEWFAKAVEAGADAVVFDLEDAVAAPKKDEAARTLSLFLAQQRDEVSGFVRLNGMSSPLVAEENRLLNENPKLGVVLPKVDHALQMEKLLEQYPSARERKVILLLETASGLENCSELLMRYHPFAVGLGLEDLLSASVFAGHDLRDFVRFARCRMALAGAAHNCLTIDTVSLDTSGGEDFAKNCAEARSCGLRAKFTIHPSQILPTNRAFSPEAAAVTEAKSLLEAYGHQTAVGYAVHNGKIVSPPTLAKAKLIAEFAEANTLE